MFANNTDYTLSALQIKELKAMKDQVKKLLTENLVDLDTETALVEVYRNLDKVTKQNEKAAEELEG